MHDGTEFFVSRAGRLLGRLSGLALLASGALLAVTAVAGPAGAATSHAPASSGYGWVRLAHLSPNTPPVNVYLYSYGKPSAMVVLHHVSYGTVSPYERVPHGEYTVAMRGVGASPSSTPVLSNNLMVHPGHAYTVAGVGPEQGAAAPGPRRPADHAQGQVAGPGHPGVAEAAPRHRHGRRRHAGRQPRVRRRHRLRDRPRPAPGWCTPRASPRSWSGQVKLTPGTIHTLVVLDSSSGLEVTDLMDAAGSSVMPNGGAATGLGGTAPAPGSSPLPWLAALVAGALLTLAGGYRLRRVRAVARHAR